MLFVIIGGFQVKSVASVFSFPLSQGTENSALTAGKRGNQSM